MGVGTLGVAGVGAQWLEAFAGTKLQAGHARGAAGQLDARHQIGAAGAGDFRARQREFARLDARVAAEIGFGKALGMADGVDAPVGHLGAAFAASDQAARYQ